MNRPIKKALVTTRFLRQLKGQTAYSKVKAINPPQPYPVGGRLAKATKYKVFEDNFQVGILDSASTKQKNKMRMFQDGGKVSNSTSESQRKYLAAIGIYIKRSTVLRAEARPLIEPIVAKESPDDMYAASFAEILSGKLKIEER